MIKIWRTGTDFLVEHDRGFWLVDASGAIRCRYEATAWAIDDDAGSSTHVISGTQLRERTIRATGDPIDRVVLEDLQPDTDPETQRFITTVLGDADVAREEARLRNARAGEARIAAIAGARRDHGLGEDFARAQHALCEHVRAYDDELYAALLRTLLALARTRASRAAIGEYLRACLLACFAHDVPQPSGGTPVAAATLADELLARARELDDRADGQEWADANANARQYRAAAAAARMAAGLLGAP